MGQFKKIAKKLPGGQIPDRMEKLTFRMFRNWLKLLGFNQKTAVKPVRVAVDTTPLVHIIDNPVISEGGKPKRRRINVGQASTVGKMRDLNEDSLYAQVTTTLYHGDRIDFGLFIIADGMGGYEMGEVASSRAVSSFAEYMISRILIPSLTAQAIPPGVDIREILENAVRTANRSVVAATQGGGTTLTALAVCCDYISIAHVGDTRAYQILPNGTINQLTSDHSLVQRLIDMGQLDKRGAMNHPQRNVLYRALGQAEPLRADVIQLNAPSYGWVALATDGLWSTVDEKVIASTILEEADLNLAARRLCELADEAGGPDNSSVILVKIEYKE